MTNRRRPAPLRDERGFTIIEMLVATMIMVAATGAIFALLDPSQGIYRTQPEVSDMQQRLRVAQNTLQSDLMMAGAGTYLSAGSGTLLNFFAPVVPYRVGTVDSDVAAGIFYRTDAITIMYVPQTASQCSIRDQMPQPSAEVKVNAQPGCPAGDPLCGFNVGMRVVIFDDTGAYDPFTVTNVQEAALHLQHRDDTFSKSYGPGAQIAQVAMHTYYLRTDVANDTFQLMHYDGYLTDEPIADNVVGLEFEYFGDPRPPLLLKAVTDPTGPWTSYGPKPPAIGVDNPSTTWGAGENCAFQIDGASGLQVPRMTDLAPGASGLVPLTQAMLTDGPWCPDGAATSRFDADLLRVRKIGVRLRVQVASAEMRGPAGQLFNRGGSSRSGLSFVPDQEIRFEITPRNMNLGR
ncbi:MAG: type II secretion system protein [Acidobacteriota bacterium]